jgi:hypothetical protein
MLISKATLSAKARKLGLATTISVLWMAATPAAAQTPISAERAAALQACSYFADDDWSYAYRACMAQHGQDE